MAGEANIENEPIILDIHTLDHLFKVDLKPLKNANARILYKIFFDSSTSKHLTTLDIQDKLKNTDVMLQKKEINAWLISLQAAGLITKESMRGKPTTIDYRGRYTYDLWGLTEKGRDIAHKIAMLSMGKTSLRGPDIGQSSFDFEQKQGSNYPESIKGADPNIIAILRALVNAKEPITLRELSEQLSPSTESLLESITQGNLNGVLSFRTEESASITEKLFCFLGMPRKRRYSFMITDFGHEILRNYDS